ncbi:NAD(+) synthase [Litorihabitans aurantiacus]|uniref:Glutamine-dependent NAD(+) synthetase n=1 Tax=Litorihabitans aurantiacus TaxID=1930061 RepID=A0AA37XGN5_9MICO|nr:NAD(+) synthase [Litorihabitans aurantiacus]GMA32659.1 NAD(+) synthase [Litorihabitans aurantiacus]
MTSPDARPAWDFRNAYRHGFARVAAVTTPVVLADPAANADAVIAQARALDADAVAVAVFPELGLTGYSIDDLVLADTLLDAAEVAVARVVEASADLLPVLVVGAPLRHGSRIYNCAVVIHRGRVLGVAPKSALPNYREFYERRWYAPGDDQRGQHITLRHLPDAEAMPFGPDLLFRAVDQPDLTIFAEVCEDFWVPIPPSAEAALAGATVLLNLSGSPITVGRAQDRHLLSASSSARGVAAYAYAAAGLGESTNDVSWDGQTMIYENGALLAETERFPHTAQASVADVDVAALASERLRQGSFDDNRRTHAARVAGFRTVEFTLDAPTGDVGLRRSVDRFPFVPDDVARLAQDCYEAFNIQVSGLEQRMRAIGMPKLVIGVSGGLDSTHALLVCAQAVDRLGLPREHVLAFTLPGFATSEGTRSNAWKLGRALGVTFEEIDIKPAATELLTALGHPFAAGEPVYDVTFENVQAGVRTDVLFRLANQRGGIVVGTGDLSELALGWCTYGVGDQMSHYAVNPGVPKTLMQHLIRWTISTEQFDGGTDAVLQAVLDTEISPELVPAGQDGAVQSTEQTIGPYALHDFALFHTLRRMSPPSKIAFLAERAWADAGAGAWPPGFPEDGRPSYDLAEIRRWLEVFLRRYFANQFKRTAIPNGPKVASGGSLSPRGDWRMPSDARATTWLAELDAALEPVLGAAERG